jgi:aryl-alcohol dehydrogenase-like predicted oxidoreductase
VVFSPLAQGVLTGKYDGKTIPPDSRAADARANQFIQRVLTPENFRRVEMLKPLAAQLGMSMAQLALAWCLRLDNVASVICGATRPQQVTDNAAAAGQKIPPDVLARIEQILA